MMKNHTLLRDKATFALLSSLFCLWMAGCVGIGGELVNLTHDSLVEPANRFTETINVRKDAEDLRSDRSGVGNATITIFAIPSGSVTTTAPVTEETVREIKMALERIGYQVTLVGQSQLPNISTPILKVRINEFWFKNYNWFWPIVPTWGNIAIGLTLENPEGKMLWDKSFTGSGRSFCLLGKCAFESAIQEALTTVLNDMVLACSSEDFRKALLMR